jgi:hypothetical protein
MLETVTFDVRLLFVILLKIMLDYGFFAYIIIY